MSVHNGFVRHGASLRTRFRNPLDFTSFGFSDWFSVFHVDFWISRFQSGFPDFKVDFYISKWILFEKLLFVILKILLMSNDVFSAQIHTECHRHFTVHCYAARTACIHVFTYITICLVPGPAHCFGPGNELICIALLARKITRPKVGRVQRSFVVRDVLLRHTKSVHARVNLVM